MIDFTVAIDPVAKARAKVTRNGTFTPGKTANYQKAIALHCPVDVQTGPLRVEIDLVLAIPRSWSKAKREQAIIGRVRPTSRPDVDNYAKAVLDAIEGRALTDDAQVVELFVRLFYDVDPSVHCRVEPIT